MRIFRTIRTIWPKLILTLVAVGIIQSVSRDLRFYYDDKVVTVKSPGDVAKLRDNMLAEIQLPLEVKDAYWKFHRSKREYELIPFVGVAYRLMWMVEGQMTERERARLKPPFKGRVVAKDGTAWRVQGKRMGAGGIVCKATDQAAGQHDGHLRCAQTVSQSGATSPWGSRNRVFSVERRDSVSPFREEA